MDKSAQKRIVETVSAVLSAWCCRRGCLFTALGFRVGFRVGFSSWIFELGFFGGIFLVGFPIKFQWFDDLNG